MRKIWGYLKNRSAVATYAVLTVALLGMGLLLWSSTATAGYPEGEKLFRENIKKGNGLGIGASPTLLIDDQKYTGRIFLPSTTQVGSQKTGSAANFTVLSDPTCETGPCECSGGHCFVSCMGGVWNTILWGVSQPLCAITCVACVAAVGASPIGWPAVAVACTGCLVCVGSEVTPTTCIGACSVDACLHGYECYPCVTWYSPPVYRCSGTTREAKVCQCDGQGYGEWKELPCPSGKSCCTTSSVVCVDLQTDKHYCGSCDNDCTTDYGDKNDENNKCINGVCCDPNVVGLSSFTATSGATQPISQSFRLLGLLAGAEGLGALAAGAVMWRRHKQK